jgi:superfamily II DNA or RNA helicase
MHLTSALAPVTTQSTRSKGERYFHSHAVVHFDPQASMVYAVVSGTEDYVVRIEVAGAEIRGTCTCPFFDDRLEPCKHLWAVALTCDARNVVQFPDGPAGRHVTFVPVPMDEEPDPFYGADDDPEFVVPPSVGPARVARARSDPLPRWQQALVTIASSAGAERPALADAPAGQLLYVVDTAGSRQGNGLLVHVLHQDRKQNGEWRTPKPARLLVSERRALPPEDRAVLEQASGARALGYWQWPGAELPAAFHLQGTLALQLLPAICLTGRARLAKTTSSGSRVQDLPLVPIVWNDEHWHCELRIRRDDEHGSYVIEGAMMSGGTIVPLTEVDLLVDDGLAIARGTAMRVDSGPLMPWLRQLETGALQIPVEHADWLRQTLVASGVPDLPGIPTELRTAVVDVVPTPHLTLHQTNESQQLDVDLRFSYDGGIPQPPDGTMTAPTKDPLAVARRSPEVERAALARLADLGIRRVWDHWQRRQVMRVGPGDIPRIARTLLPEGWRIDADDVRYRMASEPPALEVSSGIDWFEVRASVRFQGIDVPLPKLLEAVQRRQATIELDDGSVGILPEGWLKELAPLGLGTREGDHLRFRRSQVALLDALLATRPAVSWDERAEAARERVRSFDRIAPLDPPASFEGALRGYQREALGWTAFLREFGFGGCLADDMGLGKTVVVLAVLDARRDAREKEGAPLRPSLVVVPRSVLFNWEQEAARFAPRLRVLDFSGGDRSGRMHLIAEHDLVLTTYGTLRRDAAALADVEFDYVVLDEAQAIKNANTAGAKAARLLRGQHRLALSGTPVENRLADLWSIFEFLNPGLLSGATAFGRSFAGSSSPEELAVLSRALRPFILRRTKDQVALELPPKTEQTIVCELEKRQRALYNELRDHYRQRLLGRAATSWQRSKMQVLEALLRLRQAACHPALIDPSHHGEPSAKLDLLVPRLLETIAEGHKALVFSQFTSFLKLLRVQLDAKRVAYEYLDGSTTDREARVRHFQEDERCGLFLISLKAGGVGLNLAAADYVFILDPWWNPAAEAQAVDRTHRIGQTRNVFAYRLIAKDTVEERVLELQQRKRDLADAIITADNSIVRSLQREDLELLLS